MLSIVEENYLKALFNLADENGEVNVNDLSKRLSIKMPTVTSMMKKLATKELVHYQSYKPIKLTKTGYQAAALVIRKHRLTEMYLVEKMGFGWETVHSIAEQIEHIKSPIFFDKLDELLDFPDFDPHGAPIPNKNGVLPSKKRVKLADCKVGETVILSAVMNTSEAFLQFLNQRNLQLNDAIKIKAIEPFDQSMIVSYKNFESEMLSAEICRKLLVEKVNEKNA